MLKKWIFTVLIVFNLAKCYSIFCEEILIPKHGSNTILISIPKSGTHLLSKCLKILLNHTIKEGDVRWTRQPSPEYPKYFYEIPFNTLECIIKGSNKFIWITHLMYKPEYSLLFTQAESSFFFCYRDPRDQVVSLARYMIKNPEVWKEANLTSFDDLIMDIITQGSLSRNHPPGQGIFDLYSRYLPWMDVSGCCCVSFESLVGSKGGGSDQLQLIEIHRIANHLGISLSEDRAIQIGSELFGGTFTFLDSKAIAGEGNTGQIGSWKNAFTEKHKSVFKELAGQLLIDLGYEKDFNW